VLKIRNEAAFTIEKGGIKGTASRLRGLFPSRAAA